MAFWSNERNAVAPGGREVVRRELCLWWLRGGEAWDGHGW